jgi:PAS domain-containing protein
MSLRGTANVKSHIDVLEELTKQLVKQSPNSQGFHEILDAVPIGIGLFRSRTCIWINHFGCRLFGYNHNCEIIGKNAVQLYVDEAEYERVGKCIYPEGITVAHVKKFDGSEKQVVIRILKSDPETEEALVLFYSMEDMMYLCKSICICDSIKEMIFDFKESGKCDEDAS